MIPVREHVTLWVCVDCMYAYHEGDYTKTDEHDRQPWSTFDLSDGAPTICSQVSPGMFAYEHAEDCAIRRPGFDECSWDGACERKDFSWSDCDACGSWLGGTRYAFTQWTEEA